MTAFAVNCGERFDVKHLSHASMQTKGEKCFAEQTNKLAYLLLSFQEDGSF